MLPNYRDGYHALMQLPELTVLFCLRYLLANQLPTRICATFLHLTHAMILRSRGLSHNPLLNGYDVKPSSSSRSCVLEILTETAPSLRWSWNRTKLPTGEASDPVGGDKPSGVHPEQRETGSSPYSLDQ